VVVELFHAYKWRGGAVLVAVMQGCKCTQKQIVSLRIRPSFSLFII
jgi:hypothetical protein